MAGVRTLVVWCPDWPVTAAGFAPYEPVVVVEGEVVLACSAAARASGVQRGLRRREAQARCPEAMVVPTDVGREARAFEPVVAAVEAFVPSVEITRPGVCAFATRGPSRYFGGDEALAATVTATVDRAVAETAGDRRGPAVAMPAAHRPGVPGGDKPRTREGAQLRCRVGVADGPFAAMLAARRGRIVPPGEAAAFLAPFPVAALERPELADLLHRLGVRTLGDLAALPAADVLARFGPDGEVAHRLANGLDEQPVVVRRPPPDLAVSVELDPPVGRVDAAAFAAKALADELSARLLDRGLACSRIRVEAETEHGEELVRLWRHESTLTAAAMAERVRWQLEGWLSARAPCACPAGTACRGGGCSSPAGTSGGLTALRLVPDELHPDHGRQLGFWSGGSATDARAARIIARVQGLLGPEAVAAAVLGGGRSPGEQVRLVPWGDLREPAQPGAPPIPLPPAAPRSTLHQGGRREVPTWPGAVPPPSPAVVYPVPLPAEVADAGGTPVGVDGRGLATAEPSRLSVAGEPWVGVRAWAGPWPVDERWWDPANGRCRARCQLLTDDGAAHLLSYKGGRWSVEATYD